MTRIWFELIAFETAFDLLDSLDVQCIAESGCAVKVHYAAAILHANHQLSTMLIGV